MLRWGSCLQGRCRGQQKRGSVGERSAWELGSNSRASAVLRIKCQGLQRAAPSPEQGCSSCPVYRELLLATSSRL